MTILPAVGRRSFERRSRSSVLHQVAELSAAVVRLRRGRQRAQRRAARRRPRGDLSGAVVLIEVPSGTSPSVLAPLAYAVVAAGGAPRTMPRTMGSGALATALVAAGVVHGLVHAGPSIWDVAAGAALVEQAGGTARGLDGPYVLGDPGPLVAASAPAAERLLEALGRCRPATRRRRPKRMGG